MTSTIIVYFLTTGVLLPPIVIFSVLLCGLASLDSNHPSFFPFFLAFGFFAFCLFAFLHLRLFAFAFLPLRFCYHTPTKNHWLADKSKGEIMTEVLRVFAGLDVKAVQVAYEVVRVTFASLELFRAAKWFSGKHLFGLWCSILEGGPPIMRVHVFDFPRRMTYPWRLLSRSMVQSSLSKSRLFFPIKTSLMVPGLLMFSYLGYYPAFWWWTGISVVYGIVVNPLFAIFVPFRATDRQTALTRTSAESVGKPGTLLGIVPMMGQRETLRIFRPWPHLRSLRRPVSLVVLLNSAS